jgi:hypothetical protein
MGWCSDQETHYENQRRYNRMKRKGFCTEAIKSHDTEHEWRGRGEEAIRQEMEKRVSTHLNKLKKKRKAGG